MTPAASHDTAPPDRLDAALRALLQDEIAAMASALARQGRQLHRGIHAARKAGRRARSILALWGSDVPAGFSAADRRLRALTRRLSRLRDAQVAFAQAEALRPGPKQAALHRRLCTLLQRRRDALATAMLADDPRLRRYRDAARRVGAALAAAEWPQRSRKALQHAYERTARRSAKAEAQARERASLHALHRWRRRLRRWRQQREALQRLARAPALGPRARAAAARVAAHRDDHGTSLDALTARTDALGARRDRELLRAAVRRQVPASWRAAALRLCETGAPSAGDPPPIEPPPAPR